MIYYCLDLVPYAIYSVLACEALARWMHQHLGSSALLAKCPRAFACGSLTEHARSLRPRPSSCHCSKQNSVGLML